MSEQQQPDHLSNVTSQSEVALPGADQPSPAPTPEGVTPVEGASPYADPSPPEGVPAVDHQAADIPNPDAPPTMNPGGGV